MGNLFGNYTYLVGAIQYDKAAHSWRDEITPFLQGLGVNVFNPLQKKLLHQHRDEIEGGKNIQFLKSLGRYKEIKENHGDALRNVDMRMSDLSNFIVVYWNNDILTVGTCEEIFYANRSKKPIIFMCEQWKINCPSWFFVSIDESMIFSSWDEVRAYLTMVDNYPKEKLADLGSRWKFFDFRSIMDDTMEQYRAHFMEGRPQ